MVGGALIERTVAEVIPELEENLRMMDSLIQMTARTLKDKEEEMKTLEDAIGVRSRAEAARAAGEVKSSGVLV
jgi:chaperonin cofactor prefoldin